MTSRAPTGAGEPSPAVILAALHESFEGPSWHGPSLSQTLHGIDAKTAAWKAAPKRNSIWELVLHLANARHRVLERMEVRTGRFPRKLSAPWFPALPETLNDQAWRDDVELLNTYQRTLVAAVPNLSPSTLAKTTGCRQAISTQLLGLALHDTWHAGQIMFIAKLFAEQAQ